MSSLNSILQTKLGLSAEEVTDQLQNYVDFARSRANESTGMEIQDLGRFIFRDNILVFEPEAGLVSAVNYKYRSLETLTLEDGKIVSLADEDMETTTASTLTERVKADDTPEEDATAVGSKSDTGKQAVTEAETEQTHDEARGQTPGEVRDKTPGEARDQTPGEASGEARGQTPGEARDQTTGDESVSKTAQQPELVGSPGSGSGKDRKSVPVKRRWTGLAIVTVVLVLSVMAVIYVVSQSGDAGPAEIVQQSDLDQDGIEQATATGEGGGNTVTDPVVDPAANNQAELLAENAADIGAADVGAADLGAADVAAADMDANDTEAGAPQEDLAATAERPARSGLSSLPETGKVYSIMIGSTRTEAQANVHVSQLPDLQYPVTVFPFERDGVSGFRIGVGFFRTIADAESAKAFLADSLPEGSWTNRVQ